LATPAPVNQANGVGGGSGRAPIGFLNPTLNHLAAASSANFNDIADGSNNDWFDDGQKVEGANDEAGTPTAPFSPDHLQYHAPGHDQQRPVRRACRRDVRGGRPLSRRGWL